MDIVQETGGLSEQTKRENHSLSFLQKSLIAGLITGFLISVSVYSIYRWSGWLIIHYSGNTQKKWVRTCVGWVDSKLPLLFKYNGYLLHPEGLDWLFKYDAEAIPFLKSMLKRDMFDDDTYDITMRYLELCSKHTETIPEIFPFTKDTDREYRLIAYSILENLRYAGNDIDPAVVDGLAETVLRGIDDPDPEISETAWKTVHELYLDTPEIRERVLLGLKSDLPAEREYAALCAGHFALALTEAVPELLRLLDYPPDFSFVSTAQQSLLNIGYRSGNLKKILKICLSHPRGTVRAWAVLASAASERKISPELRNYVTRFFCDPSEQVRINTFRVYTHLNDNPYDFLDACLLLLNEADVRKYIADAASSLEKLRMFSGEYQTMDDVFYKKGIMDPVSAYSSVPFIGVKNILLEHLHEWEPGKRIKGIAVLDFVLEGLYWEHDKGDKERLSNILYFIYKNGDYLEKLSAKYLIARTYCRWKRIRLIEPALLSEDPDLRKWGIEVFKITGFAKPKKDVNLIVPLLKSGYPETVDVICEAVINDWALQKVLRDYPGVIKEITEIQKSAPWETIFSLTYLCRMLSIVYTLDAPLLEKGLKSTDPGIRLKALKCLSLPGDHEVGAVARICELLGSEDEKVRRIGEGILAEYREGTESIRIVAAGWLKESPEEARNCIYSILADKKSVQHHGKDGILSLLRSNDPVSIREGLFILANISGTQNLTDILEIGDDGISMKKAYSEVSEYYRNIGDYVEEIFEIFRSSDNETASVAAYALHRIEGEEHPLVFKTLEFGTPREIHYILETFSYEPLRILELKEEKVRALIQKQYFIVGEEILDIIKYADLDLPVKVKILAPFLEDTGSRARKRAYRNLLYDARFYMSNLTWKGQETDWGTCVMNLLREGLADPDPEIVSFTLKTIVYRNQTDQDALERLEPLMMNALRVREFSLRKLVSDKYFTLKNDPQMIQKFIRILEIDLKTEKEFSYIRRIALKKLKEINEEGISLYEKYMFHDPGKAVPFLGEISLIPEKWFSSFANYFDDGWGVPGVAAGEILFQDMRAGKRSFYEVLNFISLMSDYGDLGDFCFKSELLALIQDVSSPVKGNRIKRGCMQILEYGISPFSPDYCSLKQAVREMEKRILPAAAENPVFQWSRKYTENALGRIHLINKWRIRRYPPQEYISKIKAEIQPNF